MRTTLFSTFAALTLITAAAHAEGGDSMGEPFAFRANGVVTVVGPASLAPAPTAQLTAPQRSSPSTEVGEAAAPRVSNHSR